MTKTMGFIIVALIVIVGVLAVLLIQEKDKDTSANGSKQTISARDLVADFHIYKDSFLSLSENEAIKKITTEGLTPRVVARDEEQFAVTDDLRNDRVNLWVRDDHVTKVDFY